MAGVNTLSVVLCLACAPVSPTALWSSATDGDGEDERNWRVGKEAGGAYMEGEHTLSGACDSLPL